MAVKGRHWVALWLLAFLVVAWVVVARQTAALRMARDLTATRAQRAALDGRRADLERRVRTATSRAVLAPRAQKGLHLRQPADTEIILLRMPGDTGREH